MCVSVFGIFTDVVKISTIQTLYFPFPLSLSLSPSSLPLGTTHSFAEEEKLAFVDWINFQLENDADLAKVLPISEEGSGLFEAVKDGLVLW